MNFNFFYFESSLLILFILYYIL